MSDSLDAFTTALEDHGIDVDSTMPAPIGTSLMYEYDPEREVKDLATVALLYAEAPDVEPNILSVTPITTTGPKDERLANYSIDRELAEQYRSDDLSKKEYVQAVRDTWTPFDHEAVSADD